MEFSQSAVTGQWLPGSDAEACTSWITIHFDESSTEYEEKNLASLVNLFRQGTTEGKIPQEALNDSGWNGYLGTMVLLSKQTQTSMPATRSKAQQSFSTTVKKTQTKADPQGLNHTLRDFYGDKESTAKESNSTSGVRNKGKGRMIGHTLDGRTVEDDVSNFGSASRQTKGVTTRKRKAAETAAVAIDTERVGLDKMSVFVTHDMSRH